MRGTQKYTLMKVLNDPWSKNYTSFRLMHTKLVHRPEEVTAMSCEDWKAC